MIINVHEINCGITGIGIYTGCNSFYSTEMKEAVTSDIGVNMLNYQVDTIYYYYNKNNIIIK